MNSIRHLIRTARDMHKVFILLVLILAVGAFLRFFMLGAVPFGADEFLDINATYGHNQTGQWQAWDFNTGQPSKRINVESDERAWLYRIQVSKLFDISYFPPEEWAARTISALWGILTIIVIFATAWHWTRNPWIALASAFLWAVSIPALEINRTIRMYSMFAPVFLLFSWTLFQLMESKRFAVIGKDMLAKAYNLCKPLELQKIAWAYFIPVAALGVLAFHLHPLTGNIAFVLLGYLIFMAVREFWCGQKNSRYALYSALMVLIGTTTIVYVPAVNDMVTLLLAPGIALGYANHILASFWHPLLGVALLSTGLVVSLRSAWVQGSNGVGQAWIAANALIISLLAMFLWHRNVGGQYIFFAQPFIVMLTAIGAHKIITKLSAIISLKWGTLIFILLVPYYGYFLLENNTYHITAAGSRPDYDKVFDYVRHHAKVGDAMITRNFRNYYYAGMNFVVYDFGSERHGEVLAREGKVNKIDETYVREIYANHDTGWVVFADNDEDFITKEAQKYIDETFLKADDSSLIRGDVFVYSWDKNPATQSLNDITLDLQ